MKQQTLADSLGISRQAVAKSIRRGMPTSSLAAVTRWRQQFLDPARRKPMVAKNSVAAPLVTGIADLIAPDGSELPDLEEGERETLTKKVSDPQKIIESARAGFALAEKRERWAQRISEQLHSGGLYEDSRKWAALAGQISGRLPILRRQLLALEKEAGTLLHFADAERIFISQLKKLRAIIESFPSALATRCNPSDPEMARMALQEAVDRLMQVMHQDTAN